MTTRDDMRIQVLEEFACAAGWRDTDIVYWGSHRDVATAMLFTMQTELEAKHWDRDVFMNRLTCNARRNK